MFLFCLFHRFERIFLSFLWFILINAQMSTQHKKFLQIYELFGQDTSVSKKFPMLASPRWYLGIFFQIYDVFAFQPTNQSMLSSNFLSFSTAVSIDLWPRFFNIFLRHLCSGKKSNSVWVLQVFFHSKLRSIISGTHSKVAPLC